MGIGFTDLLKIMIAKEGSDLCLSTLHANNANQALDRLINFSPEEQDGQTFDSAMDIWVR